MDLTPEMAERLSDYFNNGGPELDEWDGATGFLLEMVTPFGYRQIIGPFAKDTPDVFVAIDRLRSEESKEDGPNTYNVLCLFPDPFAGISR